MTDAHETCLLRRGPQAATFRALELATERALVCQWGGARRPHADVRGGAVGGKSEARELRAVVLGDDAAERARGFGPRPGARPWPPPPPRALRADCRGGDRTGPR